MRKAVVVMTFVLSGIVLSIIFGFTLLMKRISLYQMNHMKAFH